MKLEGLSSNQIQQPEMSNRSVEAGFNIIEFSNDSNTNTVSLNNSTVLDNKTGSSFHKVSEKALTNAIKDFNKSLAGSDTKLEISVFKPTHELQVKIKDNKTGKVIREIPSQKMLELGLYMRKMAGLVVDTKI